MRFDHIGINVRDLDESVAFYRDFFGFDLIERWDSPRQAFVGKGDVVIGLLEAPEYDFRKHTMAHIAFPCSKDDFADFIKKVKDSGLEIVSGPKAQRGGETVLFRDPSGNILEVCYPSLSEWRDGGHFAGPAPSSGKEG